MVDSQQMRPDALSDADAQFVKKLAVLITTACKDRNSVLMQHATKPVRNVILPEEINKNKCKSHCP